MPQTSTWVLLQLSSLQGRQEPGLGGKGSGFDLFLHELLADMAETIVSQESWCLLKSCMAAHHEDDQE